MPQPTTCDVQDLLDSSSALFSEFQKNSNCDEDCQKKKEVASLTKNLNDAKNNLNNADSNYEAANKSLIVAKHGRGYYNNLTNEQEKEKRKRELETNISSFIHAVNSTNIEINSLKTQIDNFNLIKKLFENNRINDTLNDIFGFSVTPNVLKGEVQEGFENQDLETLNRKIYYEYKKNNFGKTVNRILYILYYILVIATTIYLFTYNFKIEKNKKIMITIFLFLYPFMKFFIIIIYDIFKIIFRFIT